MSIDFIIQIIIALLVAGFLYWAVSQFVAIIPGPPIIKQVIQVALVVLIVAVVLFYVVIPILHLFGGLHLAIPQPR